MGCFLTCFGLKKKKKKHRKSSRKRPSEEQNHGSYVPLDSDVSINLDIKENNLKEKPREPTISKIKKKVSFNLNVQAYEPIPNDYEEDDDDDLGMCLFEETKWNLHYEEDSIASGIIPHPANYRYQNCRDSYDEEEDEELKILEKDLIFDEIEDSDEEEEDDAYSNASDDEISSQEIWAEAEKRSLDNSLDLQDKEVKGLESRSSARDRSQYVLSVLNPVENLSQWKEVKAKAKARAAEQKLRCQKENLDLEQEGNSISSTRQHSDSLPLDLEKTRNANVFRHLVAVDSSLSNWLGSLETQRTI